MQVRPDGCQLQGVGSRREEVLRRQPADTSVSVQPVPGTGTRDATGHQGFHQKAGPAWSHGESRYCVFLSVALRLQVLCFRLPSAQHVTLGCGLPAEHYTGVPEGDGER